MVERSLRLLAEATRILEHADSRGIVLRASGGVAICFRVGGAEMLARLGRPPLNDIDLIGRAADTEACLELFREFGYTVDRDLLVVGEGKRFLFERNDPVAVVDLFIGGLEMCHKLDLRQRLGLHERTISLADILMQKLQIVELTRKDLVDAVALLLTHDLGASEPDIDVDYIVQLLSGDWGFWYTTMLNLERVEGALDSVGLTPAEKATVQDRIARLTEAVERSPKTRRWKLRARIGSKKKWYDEVSEGTAAF